MSDYNWCHGPSCHKYETQDRIRGVQGSKVLRTKKIKINQWNKDTIWKYFCCNTCEYNFMDKHIEEFIRLHPRPDCLETPIEDPKKTTHGNGYYNYSTWDIKVDESRQS